MTQTKKLIRAKVGPLPWPRETRGKLSPQDDDRRRGHDVSDLVISKKKRLSQDTDRSMLVGRAWLSAMRWRSDGASLPHP